ncbi:MAG: nucleoside deaminase [Patescibacteria group bacterium]
MKEAVRLSFEGMRAGKGGPFGAVIVKDGKIIGTGFNQVTSANDPTAHAEIVAIRDACRNLKTFDLMKCEIYTSCEPCPMCLGAIYWARLNKIYYANTRKNAAAIDFSDNMIYEELAKPIIKRRLPMSGLDTPKAIKAFQEWAKKTDKTAY